MFLRLLLILALMALKTAETRGLGNVRGGGGLGWRKAPRRPWERNYANRHR